MLGGSLFDAINVCINQLHDFQLAIAITRVWSDEGLVKTQATNKLLIEVLPHISVHSIEARWLLIWSHLQQSNWRGSIDCITKPMDQLLSSEFEVTIQGQDEDASRANKIFKAFEHRNNDPTLLISMYERLRQRLKTEKRWTSDIADRSSEWHLMLRSADWYRRAGLDWLGLKLVAEWQFLQPDELTTDSKMTFTNGDSIAKTVEQKSALDDWLMPDSTSTAQQKLSTQESSKPKPPPTQFFEPSADSLLDSFGF